MRRIILASMIIFFGIIISLPGPSENPKGKAHGFHRLDSIREDNTAGIIEGDEVVIYLEEVQEPMTELGIDELFGDTNTTEPSGDKNTKKESNEERKDAQQETIKVRTKLKCLESLLKNAVIEPYFINGHIEGLQINSLDGISEAQSLFLKSNDIILTVNGQTLSSKKDAYDIFIKARKKPVMTVDLLHDGEAKKLLFDFH